MGNNPSEMDVFGWGGQGFDEILGEQTRGGQDQQMVGGADEVLGALFNASQNPAYKQALARRAAMSRPAIHNVPLVKSRDWQIGLGPISGTAGQTVTVSVQPQCLFRAEKLIAWDTPNTGTLPASGFNTNITGAFVGQKNQLPVGTGAGNVLGTIGFAPGSLGNGIKWDTCQGALSLSIQVSFVAQSTFQAILFGRTAL